jgi:lipopolysaccharide biosynthesis protein
MNQIKPIAFYLPQYHPIPENDAWWGKGFTEWTNVTKAKPQFPNHAQPHFPTDLGFYDLRLPEARQAQADLARSYGIHGFCYYHYWFNGQRLIEGPFNDVLASGEPDFPFCLFWANETWSRRWLGEEDSILMKQTHSHEDDLNHIQWLVKAFADSRYIKIDGRPLFIIYRPLDFPDISKTIEIFEQECLKNGLPKPYLLGCNARRQEFDFRTLGLDGTLDFQPQLGVLPYAFEDGRPRLSRFKRNMRLGIFSSTLKAYDETWARRRMRAIVNAREFPTYPCVFVGWDNTSRRQENAIIFANPSVQNFESDFRDVVESISCSNELDDTIVFVNAWNEWAEGNYLEPSVGKGHDYLEAIKRVVSTAAPAAVPTAVATEESIPC